MCTCSRSVHIVFMSISKTDFLLLIWDMFKVRDRFGGKV